MSSLLDIDLDYFNEAEEPARRLVQLLEWGARPISFIVRSHHVALRRWDTWLRDGDLSEPRYILHVDEHHDMMSENPTPNIGNFLYHAMQRWPEVRVHWLVQHAIDSPTMWLSAESWRALKKRFSWGPHRPRDWPKPDVVSVCTSPGFVREDRRGDLDQAVKDWQRRWSGN